MTKMNQQYLISYTSKPVITDEGTTNFKISVKYFDVVKDKVRFIRFNEDSDYIRDEHGSVREFLINNGYPVNATLNSITQRIQARQNIKSITSDQKKYLAELEDLPRATVKRYGASRGDTLRIISGKKDVDFIGKVFWTLETQHFQKLGLTTGKKKGEGEVAWCTNGVARLLKTSDCNLESYNNRINHVKREINDDLHYSNPVTACEADRNLLEFKTYKEAIGEAFEELTLEQKLIIADACHNSIPEGRFLDWIRANTDATPNMMYAYLMFINPRHTQNNLGWEHYFEVYGNYIDEVQDFDTLRSLITLGKIRGSYMLLGLDLDTMRSQDMRNIIRDAKDAQNLYR